MAENFEVLKYADETDKAYGLAGMAVALLALDAEDCLRSINLDAEPDEGMQMSPDFYLTIAPRVGAKSLWNQSLRRFQITAAMTLANVVCRQMVHRSSVQLPADVDSALRKALLLEGDSMCGLSADEVDRLYGKDFAYFSRLFRHYAVIPSVESFVRNIRQCRVVSAEDTWRIFESLTNI